MATNNDYGKLVQFFTGSALPETKNDNALYFITTKDANNQHVGKLYKGSVLIAQTNDEKHIESIESALSQFKTDVADTYATKADLSSHIEAYEALLQIARGNQGVINAILKDAPDDLKTFAAVDAKFDGILNGVKIDSFEDVEIAISGVQGEVDVLETLVGTLPEGTTAKDVVDYVNVKTAGIATEGAMTELAGRVTKAEEAIDAIEADYLVEADKTELSNAVAAEKTRAEGIEAGLRSDVDVIKGDYLKASDKTELAGDIEDNADAIADLKELVSDTPVATQISTAVAAEAKLREDADKALGERLEEVEAFFVTAEGEQLDTALDTLKEIQTYITGEGAAADQMVLDIAANKKAIEDHVATDHDFAAADATLKSELNTEIAKKADKTTVEGIDGRLTTAEGKITTLEGDLNTATTGLKARMTQAEADIDALEEKVGETGVGAQIEAAIEALKIGDYAKASALTEEINRAKAAEKTNADAIALKANDADLAAIAKTGNVNNLVQTAGDVLIFDCGNATV